MLGATSGLSDVCLTMSHVCPEEVSGQTTCYVVMVGPMCTQSSAVEPEAEGRLGLSSLPRSLSHWLGGSEAEQRARSALARSRVSQRRVLQTRIHLEQV